MSVMFVESDVHDVVPTGRVVALEAVLHARLLLASKFPRDHREVAHEVAGRRLVALHAFLRSRRRVLVAGHGPRLKRVTLRAVATELLEMGIAAIVASGAVERFLCGAVVEVRRPPVSG